MSYDNTAERGSPSRAPKLAPPAPAPVAEAEAPAPIPGGHVRVRILKKGDGRIFTGATCEKETVKFPTFRRGDFTTIARDTADQYEDAGMVEIVDEDGHAVGDPS